MINNAPHTEWSRVGTASLAVLAYLVLGAGWSSAPVAANGNSLGTKSVDLDSLTTRFDAVTIPKVTVAGQEIQPGRSVGAEEITPGTPFQADEDWLKNMSIFIKNRTDRVIVCVEVQLLFPDTGNGITLPVTVYNTRVGQLPEWAQYYRDGTKRPPDPTKKPLLLTPGNTLEIRVADSIDQIKAAVEDKLPFQQITRVNTSRRVVYFQGGMRWYAGGYEVPAPDRPGYYTQLADGYFPGNALQYSARE